MSESIDHSWICREDPVNESARGFKGDHGNAQFSLCCTSTAMPDDDSQGRHPAFSFLLETYVIGVMPTLLRSGIAELQGVALFFKPRDMPGGKLPPPIALD
jgi:hypothetical protein